MRTIRHACLLVLLFLVESVLAADSRPQDPVQEARVERLLTQLTLEEKVTLLSGATSFATADIARLGIHSMNFSDGPYGVRSNGGDVATVFPVGLALAATWDPALVGAVGKAIGEEAHALDVQVLLGPNLNLVRSPLSGRNFETYGEDPLLAARMGVNFVRGVQSAGVGASPKHFVGNEQETERGRGSSNIDFRTLHELYLLPFEAVVREAHPWAMMAAYNRVNGVYMSDHDALLNQMLKRDWGFDGIVMSDWGGTHSALSVNNGLDLEMPGPPAQFGDKLLKAARDFLVSERAINEATRRMLRLYARTGHLDEAGRDTENAATPTHAQVARTAAAQAITLLKNERQALPLNIDKSSDRNVDKVTRIALIGPNVDAAIIQGGGSSQVIAAEYVTPLDAIEQLVGKHVALTHETGVDNEVAPPTLDARYISTTRDGKVPGLQARYFANKTWSGKAARTHVETTLGSMSIGEGVSHGYGALSARWSGFFTAPETGEYEFTTEHLNTDLHSDFVADDAVVQARVKVGGKLIVGPQTAVSKDATIAFLPTIARTARVTLQAGKVYALEIEYSADSVAFNTFRVGMRQPKGNIAKAVELARNADAAIVFVGSSTTSETEGRDRESLRLFGKQDELVEAVAAVNTRTIVVLNNGGPVEMPWVNQVEAIVEAWLPGQEGARAVADVLFGRVNPSGKLPLTFPRRLQDNPTYLFFPGTRDANYGEQVFMGYRYYDKKDVEPLFAFGHGLSYTQFEYRNLHVPAQSASGEPVSVDVEVKNSGLREGTEIVQLYVSDPHCTETCPERELKSFARVELQPGETKVVKLQLEARDFSHYDSYDRMWHVIPGRFDIAVGSSSRDLRQHGLIEIHTPQ